MTKDAKIKDKDAKPKGKHGASRGRRELPLFTPEEVIILGHDTEEDDPKYAHLRHLIDKESNETPVNESSVRWTMRKGIIQPPIGQRDGGQLIIVAGRGRTRLLREANKRLVERGEEPWLLEVKIAVGDEVHMIELRHGENAHRRELDPYFRAADANLLISKGKSKESVAELFGVTVQQLNNILLILELHPQVVKAVRSGAIKQTAAAGLAKLGKAEQVSKLKEILASDTKPTVGNVRNAVRAGNGQAPIETPRAKLAKASQILADLKEEEVDRGALETAIRNLRTIVAKAA